MKRWLLLLILLVPLAAAQEPFLYDSLTIDGLILNPISIQATSGRASMSEFTANISWFPRVIENQQEVSFFTTIPQAVVEENGVIFNLKRPSPGDYSFDIEYQVKTEVDKLHIKDKISFPMPPLSPSLITFLQSTDTIDQNDDIKELASNLAAGEDDLFIVVSKMASWTKEHIEYDLSTVAVEASQPSSWVLKNRQGVCDEMTNLFISMLRSLGIPARFVSGLSYTNSELFDDPWGAHGWAEVYFPGVGWVPFDVTYGQLGWVDATHIVFSEGVDGGKYASSFEWLRRDMDVSALGMQLDASIVKEGNIIEPTLLVTISTVGDEVGIGSYNVITATVTNPTTHYVADELSLGLVKGYEMLDPMSRVVMLRPGEKSYVYWRVRVDPNLESGYLYTYPLVVQSSRGATGGASFTVTSGKRFFSKDWVDNYVKNARGSDESEYASTVSFSCDVIANSIPRPDEPIAVLCSLSNAGKTDLKDVQICFEQNCVSKDVDVKGIAHHTFNPSFNASSVYALSFDAHHNLFEKFAYVSIEVLDEPVVQIHNLTVPAAIDFSGGDTIHFEVSHLGGGPARDATVALIGPRMRKEWSFDELVGTKVFDITIAGDALLFDGGQFSVQVTYTDERGDVHVFAQPFFVELGEAAWYQKAFLWFVTFFEGK